MRRSTKSLVAAGAACTVLLAGCSSSDDAGSAASTDGALSGEVTMWIYPVITDETAHQEFWDEQIAAFQEENPDVDVTVEIYPWAGRDESLATAIASGTEPDVVYLIPDQLATYQSSIEPIDDYLSDEHVADILSNVVDSVTVDGEMLGSPLLTTSYPLICDKAAFDAIGVTDYPTTWEDLLEVAPALAEQGIYATNYWGSTEVTLNMTFYPLLWQAGGDVFNEDGTEVTFNSDAGVAALEYLMELNDGGYLEPDLLTTTPSIEQTAIAQNKVACTWQSGPSDVEAYWGTDNIIVQAPLTEEESVGYGTVGSLSMLQGSENKDAAGAWIDFVTQADPITEYVTAASMFSPLTSTGELYADDPLYSAIEATIPDTTVGPINEHSREVMGVLAPEIQAALLGQKTAQEALDDAADSANALLG
ncbi:MAG TPA: sugar ABC transporter substrate-binding protein [Cellulomonas sp.]